jgi:hypothetical protein
MRRRARGGGRTWKEEQALMVRENDRIRVWGHLKRRIVATCVNDIINASRYI